MIAAALLHLSYLCAFFTPAHRPTRGVHFVEEGLPVLDLIRACAPTKQKMLLMAFSLAQEILEERERHIDRVT